MAHAWAERRPRNLLRRSVSGAPDGVSVRCQWPLEGAATYGWAWARDPLTSFQIGARLVVARDIDTHMDAKPATPGRGWRRRPALVQRQQPLLDRVLLGRGHGIGSALPRWSIKSRRRFRPASPPTRKMAGDGVRSKDPSSPDCVICVAGGDPFEGSLALSRMRARRSPGHPLVTEASQQRAKTSAGCRPAVRCPRVGRRSATSAGGRGTTGQAPIPGRRRPVGGAACPRTGAIISFAIDEGRVRFDVNRTAAGTQWAAPQFEASQNCASGEVVHADFPAHIVGLRNSRGGGSSAMKPFKDQPIARKALTLGLAPTICSLLLVSIASVTAT